MPATEVLVDGLPHFPNGCAVTADGRHLWLVESRVPTVNRIDLARGEIETLAEDPQGTVLAAPTNVVFVGDRRDRLVSANLGRWHLTLLDVGLRGAPLHYPDRWAVDA